MIHDRMSTEEIAALKRVMFRGSGEQAPECAICLEEYEDGDMQLHLDCGHYYHDDCMSNWFSDSGRACPLCRKE